jgi:hypothetical protein
MTTTEPAVTTVTITLQSRVHGNDAPTVTVLANLTPTPGLVVTPQISQHGMTGRWEVTHARSGTAVPIGDDGRVDIDTAYRIAVALGTVPVDWTADRDTVIVQVTEHWPAVTAAIAAGTAGAADPPAFDEGLRTFVERQQTAVRDRWRIHV